MKTDDLMPAGDRRGTDSLKWHVCRHGDILPMWVADMDFESPACIQRALKERLDSGVFGYSVPLPRVTDAVIQWLKNRYNWEIQRSWLVWLPGLVPGLHAACRAFAPPAQAVGIFTPVYPPFIQAPELTGRSLVKLPLEQAADGHWHIDYSALESAARKDLKLLLLCHPHNPVGKVFSRADLEKISAICIKYGVTVCSDEIHCDLILDDRPHTPLPSLSEAISRQSICLMSPAKTFNTAGLNCGFAVIPDAGLRKQYRAAMEGIIPHPNLFGYVACRAAFEAGEPWRRQLLAYLRGNLEFLSAFLHDHLPMLRLSPVEATYLAWLDTRDTGQKNTHDFFRGAGVMLADGNAFDGSGFMRLNFGCPRPILETALKRMAAAVNQPEGRFPETSAPARS